MFVLVRSGVRSRKDSAQRDRLSVRQRTHANACSISTSWGFTGLSPVPPITERPAQGAFCFRCEDEMSSNGADVSKMSATFADTSRRHPRGGGRPDEEQPRHDEADVAGA